MLKLRPIAAFSMVVVFVATLVFVVLVLVKPRLLESTAGNEEQTDTPVTAEASTVRFGSDIELLDSDVEQNGNTWTVTLLWKAIEQPKADYSILVHAIENDQLITQIDTMLQGSLQTSPGTEAVDLQTSSWVADQLVQSTHTLSFISDNPTPDAVYVGLYDAQTGTRLSASQGDVQLGRYQAMIWSEPPEVSSAIGTSTPSQPTPTETPSIIATPTVTLVPSPTAGPLLAAFLAPTLEAIAGSGGFTTMPFDTTLLLPLAFYGGGYENPGPGCNQLWETTLNSGEKPISPDFKVMAFDQNIGEYWLCLLGYPAQEDIPIQVDLFSPTGEQYTETYVVTPEKNETVVHGQQYGDTWLGMPQGNVVQYDGAAITTIRLSIAIGLPEGDWTAQITAQTNEGLLVKTATFSVEHALRVDALPYLGLNPFKKGSYSHSGPHLGQGQPVYFFGTHYPPTSPVIIALYVVDSQSPHPVYATQLEANSEGRVETTFIIGPDMPNGTYLVMSGAKPDGLTFDVPPIEIEVDK